MNISVDCIQCIMKKADNLFCRFINDDKERLIFRKEVLNEISSYDDNITAPFLNSRVMRILKKKVNVKDLYLEEKNMYNDRMLLLENDILEIIDNSNDKLLTALKYAMIGNFIDFGAMDKIEDNLLKNIIKTASSQKINLKLYEIFKNELINAKSLCYITDNAGEIVFDRLFIKTIKEFNKNIRLDIVVRGEPVLNDATIEDALKVKLNDFGNIIKNGTDIPGTDLKEVNDETIKVMNNSDLIIAKGQGNFETLYGCGKNIYYLFLCKCDMFVKMFNTEKFKGIFMNEIKEKNNK